MINNKPKDNLARQNTNLFGETVQATGIHVQKTLVIAGTILQLNFSDSDLAVDFSRAFSHLEIQSHENPDCALYIWDGASTGIEPIGIPDENALEAIRRTPGKEKPTWNPSLYSNESDFQILFEVGTGAFSLLSASQGLGIYWVPDKETISYWDFGAPFRNIISWWLTSRNLAMVHAGAIGLPEGGVLLAGKGGSGKSTTCLRALNSTLQFAGDDYVCVETSPHASVHSIYGSAKINFDNVFRVPEIESEIINNGKQDEKALLFPAKFAREKMISGFPIKAILLPIVTNQQETRIIPTSPTTGLTAIAPTSMFQLRGDRRASFDLFIKLVRDVPCYKLELGKVSPTIFDQIKELILQN